MNSSKNGNHRTLIVDGEKFTVLVEQSEDKRWKASGTFRLNEIEATGQSESSAINSLERSANQVLRKA